MIFASAGHRAPYNRLIRRLDVWAAGTPAPLFAQVGVGGYRPAHFRSAVMLDASELSETLDLATLIISDTNIELLIAAVERQIPMIVLPRQSIFGEDVGAVQRALGARVSHIPGIVVAEDEVDLIGHVEAHQRNALPNARPSVPDRSGMVLSILGGLAS